LGRIAADEKSLRHIRFIRAHIDELRRSQNCLPKWRTSAPLSFRRPIRHSVPRLPACPDLMPVVATDVRVGVRVAGRNRQHFNGWNSRVRRAHDSVDKKIVEFSHVLTVGALYFDLAAKMVVVRKRVGPDLHGNDLRNWGTYTSCSFPLELLHRGIVQVEQREKQSTFSCHKFIKSFAVAGPCPA
jgi:hypothetical protein